MVADAILYAAEHPVRDLVVGGAGQALLLLQRLSPRLADAFLLRAGFTQQRTDEAKTAEAPNNLFEPIQSDGRVEGDFQEQAKSVSPYTCFQTHPATKRAIIGAAFGAITLLAARALMPRGRRG